jgi:hypothetical protein
VLPPGRFSTITGWPHRAERPSATSRAITSFTPPAGVETIRRTGALGKLRSKAGAAVEAQSKTIAASIISH